MMAVSASTVLLAAEKETTMVLLKGCPRCHGDLMVVTYMDERSTNFLQCGFTRSLPEEHRATSLRARRAMPAAGPRAR